MKTWTFAISMLVTSVAANFLILPPMAIAAETVTVYKSPTCGCCTKWEDHLRKAGFKVETNTTVSVNGKKSEHKVPEALWSCHTAIVNGYVVEGHVPAQSIKKLLKEKPKKVVGIAVPGMPVGSPGMEGPNPEKYSVVSFTKDGKTKVFEKY